MQIMKQFLEMRMEGKTNDEIAAELGVSRQTLFNWSKDRNVSDLMRFAHMARLQSIAKKYQLNREAAVEFHGIFLQKCREELETRNLDDLPTEKLWNLFVEVKHNARSKFLSPQTFSDPMDFGINLGENYVIDPLD